MTTVQLRGAVAVHALDGHVDLRHSAANCVCEKNSVVLLASMSALDTAHLYLTNSSRTRCCRLWRP